MFFRQQKHYHTHGFLYILSLIAAFLLGRKSEQYGYTIIARGHGCCSNASAESESESESEMDKKNDLIPENSFPQ